MRIIAIDTETYFDKECSVKDLGPWHYCRHPEWYCYLLTAAWEDKTWVGEPKDFDWSLADGATWVMANAAFDLSVIERLQELGLVPTHIKSHRVVDVLDLTAYLGYPRSLASASEYLLGEAMSKEVRNNMKGKHWRDLTREEQKAMLEYAVKDAVNTLRVWDAHNAKWPLWEQDVSAITREMSMRGVPIDTRLVDEQISFLELALWKARKRIPWVEDESTSALSPKALKAECAKHGIEPPKSLAQDSEELEEWMELYGERFEFIRTMSEVRRINALLKKLQTMKARIKPDGWMPLATLYFGSHTGRDAAGGGFNHMNLPRAPLYFDAEDQLITDEKRIWEIQDTKGALPAFVAKAIDIRSCIKAPEGYVLIPTDAAQIEARVTLALAGDKASLELAKKGISVYEIHARESMGYSDPAPLKKKDEMLYHTAKTRVLGLGFACGWLKFVTFAKAMLRRPVFERIFGAPVTAEQVEYVGWHLAKRKDPSGRQAFAEWPSLDAFTKTTWVNSFYQVRDFRENSPLIVAAWNRLRDALEKKVGYDFAMELPSGRVLRYKALKSSKDADGSTKLSAFFPRNGKLMRVGIHPGLAFENVVQSCARDIFMDRCLELHKRGYTILMRVHDEVVPMVRAEEAEAKAREIAEVMCAPPSWMPNIPLGIDQTVTPFYKK